MLQPILTIAIPTYNRSFFLKRCLQSITSQLTGLEDKVEIIVSNNASTDNTIDVIGHFINNDNLIYIENENNLGMDANFIKCFEKSTGRYLWIFGDDDFLVKDMLRKIVNILEKKEYGCVYVISTSFSDISHFRVKDNNEGELQLSEYNNSLDFYKRVNIMTTFLSANITNKSLLRQKFDYNLYSYTNLVQLLWVIPSIFNGYKNLIIENDVVASQTDNSGGYKFIKTFSKNYNIILKKLVSVGIHKDIIRITNEELVNNFFPQYVYKILYSDTKFNEEKGFLVLFNTFWSYLGFWKKLFPMYFKYTIKQVIHYKK